MRWKLTLCTALLALAASAQTTDQEGRRSGGLRIDLVTLYSGYSSVALPESFENYPYAGSAPALQWDVISGAGAIMEWTRPTQKSRLSLRYGFSYDSLARLSSANSLNHSVRLLDEVAISPRWQLGLSLSGTAASFSSYLFAPIPSGRFGVAPETGDELATSVLAGSNPGRFPSDASEYGAMAYSTSFYGNRMLVASASAWAVYSASPRLRVQFSLDGSRSHYKTDSAFAGAAATTFGMPGTFTASAGIGLVYEMSSRTVLGLNMNATRSISSSRDTYEPTVSLLLGRRLKRRWYVRAGGGWSSVMTVWQRYSFPSGRQYSADGATIFQSGHHSLTAEGRQMNFELYGWGAGEITEARGSWTWRPPSSRWALDGAFRWQRSNSGVFEDLKNRTASLGPRLKLSTGVVASLTYAFSTHSGTFLGVHRQIDVHAVRLAFEWRAEPRW